MSSQDNHIFRDEEHAGGKLGRKFAESPFMLAGIAGLVGVCGIAAYKFKNKGNMKTSVFLIQTRVAAQGTVISCLTLGLLYKMFKEHVLGSE